ncbi:uncharacterized protein LOC100835893 [Brachypodium distachyon]|uniref:At1g61320/AtMIF1 LRR domain-containing protein n=1 Tax=Brachypodium distachyon TaxID=15368 RepID=A0A0Q3KUR2_BRADI|nr:uncharacterized protein LOC100835893 [Brachypodium distachyon]KQK14913.1 hypothetical protein BRADI_1g19483v3 [Brachypodium distachyon]|eukprot:XP_024313416.1 uncharacterized protein LOC100835893 [Brachypodium distachyon]
MELNNGERVDIIEDEDGLSALMDDILLAILGRVDITTAARTSALSTRWKHLPWLLRELIIDVKDFLPVPQPKPIDAAHMDQAMSSLTRATKSFLAIPRTECAITKLQLKLYLINNYSCDIGPLVSEIIDMGILKDLDLAILDEKEIADCTDEQMLQQAGAVNGFFSAYPSVLNCLRRLSLYNLCFAEWDINHHLFDCCKELQHLTLSNCDEGMPSVWKIDAPDSKLRVLELEFCWLRRLEVVCLPKLEKLCWDTWLCLYSPVKFDVAPSLKELYLTSVKAEGQKGFILSKVLRGTRSIQTIKLDFQGESIWIQPEGKQFCAAFSNLRKLSLHGIFVEFDLLWTIVFLEAVPRLEIFDIEVWEHPCQIEEERSYPMERVNPSWKLSELTSSCNSCLKELQIIGFKPLEQQLTFIKAVMKRAPNLGTVVLKYDDPCKDCEAIGIFPPRPSKECIFPMNKDKQDMVVKLIRDGVSSPAQIIFCT